MPGGQGYRARTRDMFKRGYRQKGYIPLSTYLRTYKLGDFVDIVVNGAVQKVSWEHESLCRHRNEANGTLLLRCSCNDTCYDIDCYFS